MWSFSFNLSKRNDSLSLLIVLPYFGSFLRIKWPTTTTTQLLIEITITYHDCSKSLPILWLNYIHFKVYQIFFYQALMNLKLTLEEEVITFLIKYCRVCSIIIVLFNVGSQCTRHLFTFLIIGNSHQTHDVDLLCVTTHI